MIDAKSYLRKLEKSPGFVQTLPNSWADYIELICLASIDNEISEADVIDRLSGRVKDLREDSEAGLAEIDQLQIEVFDEDEPSRRAEVSDRWRIRVHDYFKVLSFREAIYGSFYPFIIDDSCIRRKLDLDEKTLLYIYLLLCSNLYLIDNVTRTELASYYELLSLNVFKKLLPPNAKAYLFGKNPYNRGSRFSTGSFWTKLNKLRKDINELRNPHLKRTDFSEYNTGDEGLDIVGWVPTNDRLPSVLVFFAQCACTYEFDEKQHSSSYAAWSHKLSFKNPPVNTTFIPHCFRNANGAWINSAKIMGTFLIDRSRFLNFYSDSNEIKFSSMPIYKIASDVAALKESIV